jgi:hypothetical protein
MIFRKYRHLNKNFTLRIGHKTCNFYTGYLISISTFHYTVRILYHLFACSLPSLCCSFLIHALKVVAEDWIKPLLPSTRVYGVTLQMFIWVAVRSHFLPDRMNCTSVRGAYCQRGVWNTGPAREETRSCCRKPHILRRKQTASIYKQQPVSTV